jgi:hypothetical protein
VQKKTANKCVLMSGNRHAGYVFRPPAVNRHEPLDSMASLICYFQARNDGEVPFGEWTLAMPLADVSVSSTSPPMKQSLDNTDTYSRWSPFMVMRIEATRSSGFARLSHPEPTCRWKPRTDLDPYVLCCSRT